MYNSNFDTWARAQYWHTHAMPLDTVLEKLISKEVARDTRLSTLTLAVTLMCHVITHLGKREMCNIG